MLILPISQISEEDQSLFGANLYHLAQLKRAGLPVADGVAVSPPDFLLQTVLKHFSNTHHEVFAQKLELVKAEISQVVIPTELESALKGHNPKLAWRQMLDRWLDQIKARIWTHGFYDGLTLNLQAQVVFFISGTDTVTAGVDPDSKETMVETTAKLTIDELNQIKKLVADANQKLYLPQNYSFLRAKKIYLVGVAPYTQPVAQSSEQMVRVPPKQEKALIKTTVKVFANLPQGLADLGKVEGILVEAERFLDPEQTTLRLIETALHYPQQPIIFKLPAPPIRFKSSVEVFNFIRHKKGHLNLQLGIPAAKSANEYASVKKELALFGVNRQALIKFWLEMGTPANLLNSEEYLEVGLDGVILSLDKLHQLLFGYQSEEGEFYKHQVKTLIGFLEANLKNLSKAKVPILAYGQQVFHPDVLNFLVRDGVWGVVANTIIEAESLPETLSWVEQRVISKKSNL